MHVGMFDTQPDTFDVVIVGSGASGGTLASHLARRGVRVAIVEGGPRVDTRTDFNTHAMPFDFPTRQIPTMRPGKVGFDSERSRGVGGKTMLWNAVALRFSQRDFKGRTGTRPTNDEGFLDHAYLPSFMHNRKRDYARSFGAQVNYQNRRFAGWAKTVGGFGRGYKASVKAAYPAYIQFTPYGEMLPNAQSVRRSRSWTIRQVRPAAGPAPRALGQERRTAVQRHGALEPEDQPARLEPRRQPRSRPTLACPSGSSVSSRTSRRMGNTRRASACSRNWATRATRCWPGSRRAQCRSSSPRSGVRQFLRPCGWRRLRPQFDHWRRRRSAMSIS